MPKYIVEAPDDEECRLKMDTLPGEVMSREHVAAWILKGIRVHLRSLEKGPDVGP